MHIDCPHCQNPIEVIEEQPQEVVCPSCGSSVMVDRDTTRTFLPSMVSRRFGKYELIEQLGVGAFGTVYKARDTELDRIVAIKIPRAGSLSTQADVDRFLREARSAAQLRHPGIVTVFDAVQTEGTCILVSEYVQGATLADRIGAGRLTFRRAVEVIADVADALHVAHDHGVIHRDIKPSNIMIDLDGRPHVMDFGLAKRDASEITVTLDGQVLGTPAYMPPEQARGEAHSVDARGDVYSLGVILYELLTGELPFRGNNRMLIVQVMQDEPRPLRRLNDHIPRDLETITLKCMAKDRGGRYATAAELSADLRRYLTGEPIQARPIGMVERAWRWARRNRRVAGLSAAMVVLLLAVTVGSAVAAVIINSYRKSALKLAHSNESLAQKERKALHALSREHVRTEQQRQLADARATAEAHAKQDALLAKDAAEEATKKERTERLRAETARYAIQISLAQSEVARHNVGRAQQVLQECRPDLRGFEHRYLETVVRSRMRTHGGIRLPVNRVAFSPTGSWFASDSDFGIQIYDGQTGDKAKKLDGHTAPINSLTFSTDGMMLASAGQDGAAILWNVVTGRPIRKFGMPKAAVVSVAISPDGSHLASATIAFTTDKDGPLNPLSLGSPGTLESIRVKSEITVWEAQTGNELRVLTGPDDGVWRLEFCRDGNHLAGATGSPVGNQRPGQVLVWDIQSGEQTMALKGHSRPVSDLAVRPDGTKFATASLDSTLKIWDTATGQELQTLKGHESAVWSVAFSSDSNRIASCGLDETIRVWDAATGHQDLILGGHAGLVASVAFRPDGRVLVSGGWDETVRIWDISSDRDEFPVPGETKGRILTVQRDGTRFVTVGDNNTALIWDSSTGQKIHNVQGHADAVSSAAFRADGQRLASGSRDKTVKVWDVDTSQEVCTLGEQIGEVTSVAFSPSGDRLATISVKRPSSATLFEIWESELKVWDIATGKEVFKIKGPIVSKTLELIGSAVAGKTMEDTLSQTVSQLISPSDLEFSPDGQQLAWYAMSSVVNICDVATGHDVITLKGHAGYVNDVVFSSDGRQLATASDDCTIKIWDAKTGKERLTLKGHAKPLRAVWFDPNGQRLASGGSDGSVRIWDMATGQETMSLTDRKRDEVNHIVFGTDELMACMDSGIVKFWKTKPIAEK